QDREIHVDDVLVARKHQPVIAGSRADPRLVLGRGHALDAFEGPPMEVQARQARFFLGLPEQQLDAHFLRSDGIDRLAGPEDDSRGDDAEDDPASARKAGRIAELLPAAIEDVLKIGRSAPASAWTARSPAAVRSPTRRLAPWAAATARTTGIIVPRHLVPFGCRENFLSICPDI